MKSLHGRDLDKHFNFLVTRIVPDRFDLLAKIDRLLLVMLKPFARFLAGTCSLFRPAFRSNALELGPCRPTVERSLFIMKILYHHRTTASDGSAVHIDGLTAALRALGAEVVMIEPPATGRDAAAKAVQVRRRCDKSFRAGCTSCSN